MESRTDSPRDSVQQPVAFRRRARAVREQCANRARYIASLECQVEARRCWKRAILPRGCVFYASLPYPFVTYQNDFSHLCASLIYSLIYSLEWHSHSGAVPTLGTAPFHRKCREASVSVKKRSVDKRHAFVRKHIRAARNAKVFVSGSKTRVDLVIENRVWSAFDGDFCCPHSCYIFLRSPFPFSLFTFHHLPFSPSLLPGHYV